MANLEKKPAKDRHRAFIFYAILFLPLAVLPGCGPVPEYLAAVDYTPLPGEDWEVSTPAAQGLDPDLVAELYYNAAQLESIYSLLVIKDGRLIAEEYFHEGSIDQKINMKSVTKSYTSALTGIALEQGCLANVDQKMMEFFPELAGRLRDPRKMEITIRELLQMRGGYPWEESSPELVKIMYAGFRPSTLVDIPLSQDPGTDFQYSNLSSHIVGMIVARACGMDLKTFGQENLFAPLGTEVGFWRQDSEGYYFGFAELEFTARDMAKFGLMVLNDGEFAGEQIVPANWVRDSLQIYSEDAWDNPVGRNFKDIGYGYQWWSVNAGGHLYNLAWGYGGQQIALEEEYDMVIVVTADSLNAQNGDQPWMLEKAILNLAADFIAALP